MLNGVFTMKIDLLNKAQLSIINKNNFRYPLAIAEKDYFLAIVLQIIYNSNLKDKLVFKGGTAIYHLYLDQLRFSEDLDFAALEPLSIDDLKEALLPYDFLEIVKYYPSSFSLKVERLKFLGPLGQANSIKLDIDLTQEIIRPIRQLAYQNIYNMEAKVQGMDLVEICAEKLRAINERARYRDFYDLAMVFKKKPVKPAEIVDILKKKELRKPLRSENILENLNIAQEAKDKAFENLYYREEITKDEIEEALKKLLPLTD